MGFALDEIKERIVKYVSEHQDDKGYNLTQNRVKDELIKVSGSPNTFTQAFKDLLDPKKDGRLQRVKVRKTIHRLALSKNEEILTEFKVKMKQVNNLLETVEKFPETSDCFEISKIDKIPKLTKFYFNQMRYLARTVGYTIDYQSPKNPPEVYCLQSRYDLLRSLPVFFVNYVTDQTNGFSKKGRDEAMRIIEPIMFDCITKIRINYSKSPYCSNEFLKTRKEITKISMIKAEPIQDIPAEFLRILGRYYFLISEKLSKWEFNSCKEQKIISEFVKSFYPKSKIPDDKLSESISEEQIEKYWFDNHKPRKRFFKKGMIKRLDEVHECLGGKFAQKFDKFRFNERFFVSDYYNNWIFTLGIFSLLEKRVIQTYFDVIEEDGRMATLEDHDEPLDELDRIEQKDFIGKLHKTSKGQAVIFLDKKYSEVEPHIGRRTRILIEEN